MRGLVLAFALVSAPVSAFEQRSIGIGDVLAAIDSERRDNVPMATLEAPLNRTIYLVEKLRLPAGSNLEWSEVRRAYCSPDKGYQTSYGDEAGICLTDADTDGRFETVTGDGIVQPVSLKAPIPYSTKSGSVISAALVKKRIVYLGGTSSEARFSYREFTTEGIARPAFTEELTVPLSGLPAQVRIKGVEFSILKQDAGGLTVEMTN